MEPTAIEEIDGLGQRLFQGCRLMPLRRHGDTLRRKGGGQHRL
jgi:hypothetical protein